LVYKGEWDRVTHSVTARNNKVIRILFRSSGIAKIALNLPMLGSCSWVYRRLPI